MVFEESERRASRSHVCCSETGGLLRLAVGLMQAFSKDERCYKTLVNNMALYFQIRDDLINLASPDYMKGKSFCEDLTVRAFSRFSYF